MSAGTIRLNESPRQFDRLVSLLAARLPDWGYRQTAAEESGLPAAQYSGDPKTGWRTLVREAVDKDRVVHLLRAAADLAKEDLELADLANRAEEGQLALPVVVPPPAALALGAAGVALVGAAVVTLGLTAYALNVGAPEAVAASAPPPVVVSAISVTPAVTPPTAVVAAAPLADAPLADEGTAEEPIEEHPVEPPKAAPAAVAMATVEYTPVDPSKLGVTACAEPRGKVVGYVFYDMRPPRSSAQVWTLTRDLNVRQDFPKASNHWNIQASEIVCVLLEGTQLHLDPGAPAIRVEGGAWWLPVVGGSAHAPK